MIYSRPDTIISETRIPCIVIDNSNNDANEVRPAYWGQEQSQNNSRLSGTVPPACGGLGGQVIQSKPINQLQPGDSVFDLDNRSVIVKHLIPDHYNGSIMEITIDQSSHIQLALPENLILCQRKVTHISEKGHWGDIPKQHFQKARQLRKQSTPPEKKLWQYLRSEQLGVKFRSQHPINHYIVDFYARNAGLVVEVDGESSHTYPDQIKHDRERDKLMEGFGLKVLRFSARDVFSNIEGVISEILYHLKEAVPDNFPCGQWQYAKNIKTGDEIYLGWNLSLCQVIAIREIEMDCDVTIISLESCGNFISNSFVFHI